MVFELDTAMSIRCRDKAGGIIVVVTNIEDQRIPIGNGPLYSGKLNASVVLRHIGIILLPLIRIGSSIGKKRFLFLIVRTDIDIRQRSVVHLNSLRPVSIQIAVI